MWPSASFRAALAPDRSPRTSDGDVVLEVRVATYGELEVFVFSKEHPPPHFRVIHGAMAADYRISDGTCLKGNLRRYNGRIRKWHAKNKALLVRVWNERRPSDCPVGLYQGS